LRDNTPRTLPAGNVSYLERRLRTIDPEESLELCNSGRSGTEPRNENSDPKTAVFISKKIY